jgi:hypothetical protein
LIVDFVVDVVFVFLYVSQREVEEIFVKGKVNDGVAFRTTEMRR